MFCDLSDMFALDSNSPCTRIHDDRFLLISRTFFANCMAAATDAFRVTLKESH